MTREHAGISLLFITGSDSKFEEARAIIPHLEHLRADLPEIQSDSPAEVIRAKLAEAQRRFGERGQFIVEDTSLHMNAIGGLPGPFVKWFLHAIKPEGLYQIADRAGSYAAEAVCMIGYVGKGSEVAFVEARVAGTIVSPRGNLGFGWDPIFVPAGESRTYAEMQPAKKAQVSPRTLVLRRLADAITSG